MTVSTIFEKIKSSFNLENGIFFMKEYYGLVYIVINLYNGKVYVGQTTQTLSARRSTHYSKLKRQDTLFGRALRKYDKSFFKWHILGYCYNKKELDESEIECINLFSSNNRLYGYNVADGGFGGSHKRIWTSSMISQFEVLNEVCTTSEIATILGIHKKVIKNGRKMFNIKVKYKDIYWTKEKRDLLKSLIHTHTNDELSKFFNIPKNTIKSTLTRYKIKRDKVELLDSAQIDLLKKLIDEKSNSELASLFSITYNQLINILYKNKIKRKNKNKRCQIDIKFEKDFIYDWLEKPCKICTTFKSRSSVITYRRNKKQYNLARVIWEDNYGYIPDGMIVAKKCNNSLCFEHTHMYLKNKHDVCVDNFKNKRVCGGKHYNSKLVESDIIEIINKVNNLKNYSVVAREYAVSPETISLIYKRKTWKHVKL